MTAVIERSERASGTCSPGPYDNVLGGRISPSLKGHNTETLWYRGPGISIILKKVRRFVILHYMPIFFENGELVHIMFLPFIYENSFVSFYQL